MIKEQELKISFVFRFGSKSSSQDLSISLGNVSSKSGFSDSVYSVYIISFIFATYVKRKQTFSSSLNVLTHYRAK